MKKVGNHNSISRNLFFSLAVLLTFSLSSFAQTGDPVKGKELFNAQCAACHKLDAKATGPALRGVGAKYDMAWIYKWVKKQF
jgi:cytochrome c2